MEVLILPQFVDVFVSPVRDNMLVQACMFALIVLIFLDVVMGVVNAVTKREFSSTILKRGLVGKVGEMVLVLVVTIIDGLTFAGLNLGFSGPILVFMLGCLIVMEIGSLMEIIADLVPDLKENRAFKFLASVKELELPVEDQQHDES